MELNFINQLHSKLFFYVKEGPNPGQARLCVGQSKCMVDTTANEGKSLDEPLTNRLESRLGNWNVGSMMGKIRKVLGEKMNAVTARLRACWKEFQGIEWSIV